MGGPCIISQAKHETLTASNGQEALELVDKEEPDLILTDVFMPELGGLELAQILQKRERFILIIFLASRRYKRGLPRLAARAVH